MKQRRTAKAVVENYANELLNRPPTDADRKAKLLVIETIALRMGWNDLYKRLRFGGNEPQRKHWWQND